MKFYIEKASNKKVEPVAGFEISDASYEFQASPQNKTMYIQEAWTVEVKTLEELLHLTNEVGGSVMVDWQTHYPPAEPRQHIPIVRIMDAEF